MPSRLKPWQLGALLALLCALAVGGFGVALHRRRRAIRRVSWTRFRCNGAVRGISTLRSCAPAACWTGWPVKKAAEDPEYRDFAEQIGFDYRTDLDGIAAAYVNGGLYAAMRGRFDWRQA